MQTSVDILMRTVVAFAALLLLTRLTGRREINQMTFPDFVSALAVGSVAANLSFGPHRNTLAMLFSLVLWIALTLAVDLLALKNRRLKLLFEGGPTVVIHRGALLEERMRKLRYSVDDVQSLLREQGIFNVADVEFAIVEPSGKLSAMKKPQHRPVTSADLSIPTQQQGMSVTLIGDGEIRERNLRIAGITRQWLLDELHRRGLSPEEVFFVQLDSGGHLYIDLRADSPPPTEAAGIIP